MTDPVDAMLAAMREAKVDPVAPTRLATVTARSAAGVNVQFDGESIASTRTYRAIGSAAVGERVVMLSVGTSWVMVGGIGAGGIGYTRGQAAVVYAAATQTQTATFAHGLGVVPASVQLQVFDERFIIAVTALDAVNVNVKCFYALGAAGVGFSLGYFWRADR